MHDFTSLSILRDRAETCPAYHDACRQASERAVREQATIYLIYNPNRDSIAVRTWDERVCMTEVGDYMFAYSDPGGTIYKNHH